MRVHAVLALSVSVSLSTLTSAGADATTSQAPADPDLVAGVDLYQNNEYEQAVVMLQRAERTPGHTSAEQASIHVMLGLCFVQLFKEAEASAQFEAALIADPRIELPDYAPPSAQQLFGRAMRSIIAQREAAAVAAPPKSTASTASTASAASAASKASANAWQLPASVALFGVSAVAVIGSGLSFVAAAGNTAIARDPAAFQSDAQAAADIANVEIGVGFALLGLGLASVSGALAVLALPAEPATEAPAPAVRAVPPTSASSR